MLLGVIGCNELVAGYHAIAQSNFNPDAYNKKVAEDFRKCIELCKEALNYLEPQDFYTRTQVEVLLIQLKEDLKK